MISPLPIHSAIPPGIGSNVLHQLALPLPLDFFHLFAWHLLVNTRFGTVSTLSRTCQAFYQIFQPILKHARLEVTQVNAAETFWGLMNTLTANENVRPTRETHQRKIDHLRSCTSLGLADLPSAKALVDAADFSGTLDPPLFRNVTHLSIGADLIWDLTDSESGPSSILYRLRETISPKHACVHYTIKPRQPWIKAYLSGALGISPCRAGENVDEDELDTLWEMRVVRSTTGCIESLVYSWNLESLTCHETGTETLPATVIPLQRFFSREDVLDEEVAVPHEWVCMERRAREVADATVLVGPPVDNHFEFVDFGCRTCGRDCVNPDQQAGAELSSPSEVSIEKGRSRRNVAKATFAAKAIQAVWDQFPQMGMKEIIEPYLSFTSREQAQPCICCGKK